MKTITTHRLALSALQNVVLFVVAASLEVASDFIEYKFGFSFLRCAAPNAARTCT